MNESQEFNYGEFYQHKYGGIYKFFSIAISTVDYSLQAVYQHQFPFLKQTYVRPLDEFRKNFTLLTKQEATMIMRGNREMFEKEIIIMKNKTTTPLR